VLPAIEAFLQVLRQLLRERILYDLLRMKPAGRGNVALVADLTARSRGA